MYLMRDAISSVEHNTFPVKHWTKFPGRPHRRLAREGVRVTLSPKGVIYLNYEAWKALGCPDVVELMFDKPRNLIGIVRADPSNPSAFPVKDRKASRSKIILASAFCTHFRVKTMRTAQFNEIEVDKDGEMSLALQSVSAVTRGSR